MLRDALRASESPEAVEAAPVHDDWPVPPKAEGTAELVTSTRSELGPWPLRCPDSDRGLLSKAYETLKFTTSNGQG